MKKFIRLDGKVAVLYSPGFGAGWSTWGDDPEVMMFHPELVQAALDGVKDIEPILDKVFPNGSPYKGGWRDIEVAWLDEGTAFYIDEYDGFEEVINYDRRGYIA